MKLNKFDNKAVCCVSLAPVRSEGRHVAEMVTQLLFGETLTILDEQPDWYHVILTLDKYEGWVSRKQIQRIDEKYFDELSKLPIYLVADRMSLCRNVETEETMPLFVGSRLPYYDFKTFKIANKIYKYSGKAHLISDSFNKKNISRLAKEFLGAPYLWGGRSIAGIDCSGLVQVIFATAGYILPRNASQQVAHGEIVDFVDEVQAGDLAFFDNLEGQIIHVGIIMELGKVIHASGQVRIDSIDHFGIYNNELQCYTHNLRIIKRLYK